MGNQDSMSEEAVAYVKKHQKELLAAFIGSVKPVSRPISIFMAGSPGAGKTEFSTHLISEILGANDTIVRIDPDEIRVWLPQYEVGRAELMQRAVSTAVNKIHDYVKANSYSFLLDGTFSGYKQAEKNVQQSLDKSRPVFVQYVIQPPEVAWQFTQEREMVDGRNIRKVDFIDQFINARDTVSAIKKNFGKLVQVDLIERNVKAKAYDITFNIDNLDTYLPKKYSRNDIEKLL